MIKLDLTLRGPALRRAVVVNDGCGLYVQQVEGGRSEGRRRNTGTNNIYTHTCTIREDSNKDDYSMGSIVHC